MAESSLWAGHIISGKWQEERGLWKEYEGGGKKVEGRRGKAWAANLRSIVSFGGFGVGWGWGGGVGVGLESLLGGPYAHKEASYATIKLIIIQIDRSFNMFVWL